MCSNPLMKVPIRSAYACATEVAGVVVNYVSCFQVEHLSQLSFAIQSLSSL